MKDKKMFVLFTITLLMMALFTSMVRMDIKEVKKEITSIPAQETTEERDMGENVVTLLMPSLVWCAVR